MAFGLDSTGYTAPRSSDFLTIIRNAFEAAVGVEVEWEKNAFLYHITAIMAQQLGETSEGSQAVYDAWLRANAVGVPLDDLGNIVGVPRIQATQSTVDITLTGDATSSGKIVTSGAIFEGGDPANPTARWTLDQDITLGVGGSPVAGTATAVDFGEITAAAGLVSVIVTPFDGLVSVTNASAASAGVPLEGDPEYRLRQQSSLQITGGRGLNSIRANLEALPGVTAAGVIDNEEGYAQTIEGILMDPHSMAVTVSPNTLTIAQQQAVAQSIYDQKAAGVKTLGDQVFTVTGADGFAKTIRYYYSTDVLAVIVYTVTLKTGYTLGQVTATIEAANIAYFASLAVGEDILYHKVLDAATGVDGLNSVTMTLNGGVVNIPVSVNETGVIDTQSVTL